MASSSLLSSPFTLKASVFHAQPSPDLLTMFISSKVAVFALLAFVVANVFVQRHLLTMDVLPLLLLVIAQNGAGLLLGFGTAVLLRLDVPDRRAVVIEGGMQNVGFALGIVAVQFNSDLQMVIFTSLWGVWHSISGLGLALIWRRSQSRFA